MSTASHRWLPVTALAVVGLVAWLVALVLRPSAQDEGDVPDDAFSAHRARAVLERIVGDESPHGVGTPANEAVRERIVAELEALGLEVELQRTFACRVTVCAPVVNILAKIEGTQGGPAVLLTSHYDSVHAGPGVADDLHAIAIAIETARSLVHTPARHDVLLLIDEGEEVGLLGAQAFVEESPHAADVAVVVNAEARGSTGLSSMFQTSDGNAELVRTFLDAAPRPRATSLAVEVYRRMPNNTDFTVLAEHGLPGLNFAFIDGVEHYHTPLDDLAHLDMGSLHHQGESVHATVIALANRELPIPSADNLVYADVLGTFVVAWPQSWTLPLAVALLVALLVLGRVAVQRGRVRAIRCPLGAVSALAVVLLTTCTAFGLALLVAWVHGEPVAAGARPDAFRIALWSTGALVGLSVATWLRAWAEPLELALGTAIAWTCVAIAIAATVPGAAVQLIAPTVVAAFGLAIATVRPRFQFSALLAGAIAMTIMWTDLALGLEDAFGFAATPLVAAPIGVVWSVVVPCLVTDRGGWTRLAAATLAITIAAVAWACIVPIHDEHTPRRVSITHYEDRSNGTSVDVLVSPGHPGAELLAAADFSAEAEAVVPWMPVPVFHARAPMTDAPAPVLDASGYRSQRGSDRAIVVFPAGSIRGLRVEGRDIAVDDSRDTKLYLFGVPRAGVSIAVEGASAGAHVTLVDCSAALPESAQRLAAVRPATAATFQWGDTSCISTVVQLAAAQ